jgi:hypothetical protein
MALEPNNSLASLDLAVFLTKLHLRLLQSAYGPRLEIRRTGPGNAQWNISVLAAWHRAHNTPIVVPKRFRAIKNGLSRCIGQRNALKSV